MTTMNPNQKADPNTMNFQENLTFLPWADFGDLRIWILLFNTISMQIPINHIPP